MELYIKPDHIEYLGPKYNIQLSEREESWGSGYDDSGFDLFIPYNKDTVDGTWVFPGNSTIRIPLGIKVIRGSCEYGTFPYYIYVRSSISKTPLRLANNQGIIDAGYRGELIIALDNISPIKWTLYPGTRLVQSCMPSLSPFNVSLVDKDFDDTERGEGGFGSTGV
jgi:dUTP pyrophosphatase